MLRSYKGIEPRVAESAFVEQSAQVIGDVQIDYQSSVWFNCVIRADVNFIKIGHSTNIQDGSVVHVTGGRFPVIIGDCVTVGHGVMLHGCRIMSHSLIGIGSIVLDDVTIGEESLVAAGSLIAPGTIVPARSVMMGSPARVRRQVTSEDLERIEAHWKNYIEYKDSYLAEQAGAHE